MPIRFRCAYCNQLLGIAHRKAGTTVRCPTCAGQIVVPTPDVEAPAPRPVPRPASRPAVPANLFERSELDDLLDLGKATVGPPRKPQAWADSGGAQALPAPQPPPGAWGTHAEPDFDVERVPILQEQVNARATRGVVLSPLWATILLVAVLLGLAAAFGLGLLAGRALRPAEAAPPPDESRRTCVVPDFFG